MEERKEMNIVDQALAHPIKYAIMLTKEVYSLNKSFFWGLSAIIVVLALLSEIPLLGLIATVISGILMFSLFLFTGKVFYKAATMDMFVEEIESISVSKLWNNYWQPAFGAYLGWVVIVLGTLFLAGFMVAVTGQADALMMGDTAAENPMMLFSVMTIPMLIVSLILYLVPLVFANTIRTDTFGDAFKSVFSLFKSDIWRRAFTGVYFKYMALLGLVLIAFVIVMIMVSALFVTLLGGIDPTMISIGVLLMVIVMVVLQVILNVFYAITAIIADRMTQDD